MNEENKMILQMLKDGSISIEEAEKLLDAVQSGNANENRGNGERPIENSSDNEQTNGNNKQKAKYFKVIVSENGKNKVNVKLPLKIMSIGSMLGQKFGVFGEHGTLMNGVNIDEILLSIKDGELEIPYTLVDVDDDEKKERVMVVIE